MSSTDGRRGRLTIFSSPEARKEALWWTLAALSVPVAGAAVWWLSENTINNLAPREYRYRPGTVSEYMSELLAKHAKRRRRRKPLRVYLDGCFDVMHYGHANALRQARMLGDELVVGLISDDEIRAAKGPPVMNYAERKTLVGSVKWVDEVIDDAPYLLSEDFLHELFTKHKIDYVVHGDDPCLLPDGTDAYAYAKQQGRFKMIKRTEGVSSTDIVGRMLMCTRDNARFREERRELTKQFSSGERRVALDELEPGDGGSVGGSPRPPAHTTISRFMPTSRRIVQFSDGVPAPPGARIVYIDGGFDLFHPGHVEILKLARAQGDFLLVGLHTDDDVMERRGAHLPIMDLHERALSVLACCYVNEVIIGAPLVVTEDLLTTFNISLVVRGTVSETGASDNAEHARYAVPKERGIMRTLQSPRDITTATIIHRIVTNRAAYEARNAKKNKSEAAYYQSKQHVTEM
ncbi:Ethanolamine-phosphate cytidylyltransferase [Coccomyxa sp. Obi]|nr:Ethanolamine-phosphate cytidylyltransferase [Coccomyxa sp. Obi]